MLGAMVTAESQFAIAHAKIISETLEGETLIIDLSRGLYFSLNRSASIVWQLLTGGVRYEEILHRVSELYPASDSILGDIEQFCQSLLNENLLVLSAEAIGATEVIVSQVHTYEYATPTMEKHNDLESLLLADPVHEFNDQ